MIQPQTRIKFEVSEARLFDKDDRCLALKLLNWVHPEDLDHRKNKTATIKATWSTMYFPFGNRIKEVEKSQILKTIFICSELQFLYILLWVALDKWSIT